MGVRALFQALTSFDRKRGAENQNRVLVVVGVLGLPLFR